MAESAIISSQESLQDLYLQFLRKETKLEKGRRCKLDSILRTISKFDPSISKFNLGLQREILGKIFRNFEEFKKYPIGKKRPLFVFGLGFQNPEMQNYCFFMENFTRLKSQIIEPELDLKILHNCFFIIKNMMPQFLKFKIYTVPICDAPLDVLYHTPGNEMKGSVLIPNTWLKIPRDESALVFARHPDGKLDLALVIDRDGFKEKEFAASVLVECKHWLKGLNNRSGCDFYGQMFLAGNRAGYESKEFFSEYYDALPQRDDPEWQRKKKIFLQTHLHRFLRMLRDHMLSLCAQKYLESGEYTKDFGVPCEMAETYFTTFAASHDFMCSSHLDSDVGFSVGVFGDFDTSTNRVCEASRISGGEFVFSGLHTYVEHSNFTTICWSSSKDIHGTAAIGKKNSKYLRFGSSVYISGTLLKSIARAWDQNASESIDPFMRELYLALKPRIEHKKNELLENEKEQRETKSKGKHLRTEEEEEAKQLRNKKIKGKEEK